MYDGFAPKARLALRARVPSTDFPCFLTPRALLRLQDISRCRLARRPRARQQLYQAGGTPIVRLDPACETPSIPSARTDPIVRILV